MAAGYRVSSLLHLHRNNSLLVHVSNSSSTQSTNSHHLTRRTSLSTLTQSFILIHQLFFNATYQVKLKAPPSFSISDDKFWKDDVPFQIIGGDLHYLRIHPQQWKDKLLKAKALRLNTIQTYVSWNLHDSKSGNGHSELCHELGPL